jgi:hypothetical protein
MTIKEIYPEDIEKVVDLLAEAELDYFDLKQPDTRLFQIVISFNNHRFGFFPIVGLPAD